jgi:hypothetical protein
MRIRRVGTLAAFCVVLAFLFAGTVIAQNVTVTIGVGDTVLEVSGVTSPGAFVTISRDGSVIGTPVAAGDGTFSQTFSAQSPGIHQISAYAHTTGGENTDTVTLNVNIAEHATTTVSIFLPPTLVLADSSLGPGQALEMSGESAPASTVAIYVDGTVYVTAVADAGGFWSATVGADALSSGQHDVFARATDGLGEQSYPTTTRQFSVAAAPQEPEAPADEVPATPRITFPQQGSVVNETDITVRGTADPDVQIEVWDESRSIGSVWSDSRGRWSLPLRLSPGSYTIRARACLDGLCSAFSPTVSFTHQADEAPSPQERPLRIVSDLYSHTTYQYLPVTLEGLVVDGRLPYAITVDWDDGKTEAFKRHHNGLLFTHVYDQPGKYTVTVGVTDAQGHTNRAYFTVHVKPRETASKVFPVIWLFLLLLPGALLLGLYLSRKWRKRHR